MRKYAAAAALYDKKAESLRSSGSVAHPSFREPLLADRSAKLCPKIREIEAGSDASSARRPAVFDRLSGGLPSNDRILVVKNKKIIT